MIALGKAISDGERNFSTILAADGESKNNVSMRQLSAAF